jgi:hypothetical protein
MYSRPYSEVHNIITDWNIQSEPQASATAYWQYIYVKHEEKLAEHHGLKTATDVPANWRQTTLQDALKNLRDKFTVSDDSDLEEDKSDLVDENSDLDEYNLVSDEDNSDLDEDNSDLDENNSEMDEEDSGLNKGESRKVPKILFHSVHFKNWHLYGHGGGLDSQIDYS